MRERSQQFQREVRAMRERLARMEQQQSSSGATLDAKVIASFRNNLNAFIKTCTSGRLDLWSTRISSFCDLALRFLDER